MLTKEWDWKNVSQREVWLEPCEESYYYALKWKRKGYKHVLDMGCGLGRHAILFAQMGFHVTAVDLSEYGIDYLNEWQKKENVSILTRVCNINDMPFSDNAFDCIWSHHVMSHCDTEGMNKVISEIERVLKPDGEIYFDLNLKEHKRFVKSGFPKADENTVIVQGGEEDGIPHFCVDMDDIEGLLKNFTINKIRHIDDCWYNGSRQLNKHYFIEATINKTYIPPDYSDVIGKQVTGKIDRPMGSVHPKFSDMIYPVNYGYVDGIFAGDGEEQDVYFLGVDEPVSEFSGIVIAVYHRYNDVEDKWIVAPDGVDFTDDEILRMCNFQEKYFHGKLFR